MDRTQIRRALARPGRAAIRLDDVARLFPGRARHAAPADGGSGAGARRRVVVVAGASAGVGRAVALAFADRGDAVALIARDPLALEEVAGEVESRGGRAMILAHVVFGAVLGTIVERVAPRR